MLDKPTLNYPPAGGLIYCFFAGNCANNTAQNIKKHPNNSRGVIVSPRTSTPHNIPNTASKLMMRAAADGGTRLCP